MNTPSAVSILGMDMCAIQKFLFNFIIIINIIIILLSMSGIKATIVRHLANDRWYPTYCQSADATVSLICVSS
jgi:hypothetical protein